MQVAPIPPLPNDPSPTPAAPTTSETATTAFGLGFDALLRIILTQLTYQDPLKPMDNFEFVSQLAQFSQVQQGQATNDRLQALVAAQATNQATALLGRRVDVPADGATLSGTVTAITFVNGAPSLTIETADRRTVSGIAINAIAQIRGEE